MGYCKNDMSPTLYMHCNFCLLVSFTYSPISCSASTQIHVLSSVLMSSMVATAAFCSCIGLSGIQCKMWRHTTVYSPTISVMKELYSLDALIKRFLLIFCDALIEQEPYKTTWLNGMSLISGVCTDYTSYYPYRLKGQLCINPHLQVGMCIIMCDLLNTQWTCQCYGSWRYQTERRWQYQSLPSVPWKCDICSR